MRILYFLSCSYMIAGLVHSSSLLNSISYRGSMIAKKYVSISSQLNKKTVSAFAGKNYEVEDTRLLYLANTYQFEGVGTLVASGADEKKGNILVLDQTIFYPQGGGQPSDVGIITSRDKKYDISFVSFADGKVYHYTPDSLDGLNVGEVLKLSIDQHRRLQHAKLHTAGHLISSVVESILPNVVATKGFHFSEGPYIEFEGDVSELDLKDFQDNLTNRINSIIQASSNVIMREINASELSQLKVGSNYKLPEGKKARTVEIEGFEPVPCGGTHLSNVAELGAIKIRKVQMPKGKLKIGYAVD